MHTNMSNFMVAWYQSVRELVLTPNTCCLMIIEIGILCSTGSSVCLYGRSALLPLTLNVAERPFDHEGDSSPQDCKPICLFSTTDSTMGLSPHSRVRQLILQSHVRDRRAYSNNQAFC